MTQRWGLDASSAVRAPSATNKNRKGNDAGEA